MRYNEIIVESKTLTARELYNREGRVELFLKKVKSLSPFTDKDNNPFIVDPNIYPELEKFFAEKKSGTFRLPEKDTGKRIPMGNLLKTIEFGGHQLAYDQDENDVVRKESLPIKPSDIFKDSTFKAENIFNEIIGNTTLQQSDIGQYIIKYAKEIQNGINPDISDLPLKYTQSITDYAGEYLGVAALIKGIVNFPTIEKFYQHLGVQNFNNLILFFPKSTTYGLGDSIGTFTNSETSYQILISSKGGKKGAATSLDNLKIPDELRNNPSFSNEIEFLDLSSNATQKEQPFELINYINSIAPESLSDELKRILPFDKNQIQAIEELMETGKYNKNDLDLLPDELIDFIKKTVDLSKVKQTSTPGLILHYAISKEVLNAINNNNALPNFEPLVREILQKNFIQIFTRIKNKKLTWDILWPNRELSLGNVTLGSKSGGTEIKGKLGFKITD